MYELVTGKQLFAVGNSLSDYQAKLASIGLMDLSGCPPQLVPTLKPMLSTQPAARPNANAFAGAPYFQVRSITSCVCEAGCAQSMVVIPSLSILGGMLCMLCNSLYPAIGSLNSSETVGSWQHWLSLICMLETGLPAGNSRDCTPGCLVLRKTICWARRESAM